MRTAAVSLTVIALALAAIVAGYLSGQAGAHPEQVVVLHPDASPSVRAVRRGASDVAVRDIFSEDDVVVDRPATGSRWQPERLSIVVGLCGDSIALDSEFLRLDLPLAFDLDPHGGDAVKVARYVRSRGFVLLVHLTEPPSPARLAALRAKFGPLDGIASQTSAGMARALAGTGVFFFDERGDADPGPFEKYGVRLLQRDATVDDRSSPSYISFMLDRAAMRSTREGPLVVLMRPLPNSLAALSQFLGTRSAEIAALTQLRSR